MIRSIELSMEHEENVKLICRNCQQIIISLKQASYFVQIKSKQQSQYFFLSQSTNSQQNSNEYFIDEFSFKIEVEAPLELIQTRKVKCKKCEFEVGLYLSGIDEKQTKWLQSCTLFNDKDIQFTNKQLKSLLKNILIQEMDRNTEESLRQGSDRQDQGTRQSVQLDLNLEILIKKSLSNIVFYSEALDEIKRRFGKQTALQKYESAKRKSAKKRTSSRKLSN